MRAAAVVYGAAALVALTLLMIAHVVQWQYSGRTVSPIEPSEAMYTLQSGAVNAGFIFFSLAILATLIFGRFVCGWGCHIVALQDFCAWLLKKCGLTPKPFRSRLLVFVPLIVALGLLRAERATAAGIALPVPGDPLGLAGPSSFNGEVVEAGEGVVLDGADLGLDRLDAGLAGGEVADVELEHRDAGLGLEALSRLVVAAVVGGDLVALGRQALRDRRADAAGAAGDEGDALLSHGFLQFLERVPVS